MGLADSNKKKQKISEDPRNTKWAHDESRPGFKMLQKMGWSPAHANTLTPDAPVLSKRLTSIPVAKEDTVGLGAPKNGPAASSIFSTFGSKGLSFVTASKDGSAEVLRERNSMTEGGHFAGLLEKLNAANKKSEPAPAAEAAAAATTAVEAAPAPRPAPSRNACVSDSTCLVWICWPKANVARVSCSSRAKFLKAKAQAKADPSDMASILGYSPFPTPSPSTSAVPSPAPTPSLPEPKSPAESPVTTAATEEAAQQDLKADKGESKKKKDKKRKMDQVQSEDAEMPADAAQESGSTRKAEKKMEKKRKREAAAAAEEAEGKPAVPTSAESTPAVSAAPSDAEQGGAESKAERKERKRRKNEEKKKRAEAEES